ncbi:MAG: AEC family transporter [Synechococcus sp.]|nr:AEC family transporter [Synechococcus sp.]
MGGHHPDLSKRLAQPLVRYGVPLSVMGLLLKGGLHRSMLEAALLAPLVVLLMVLLVSVVLRGGPWLQTPALRLGCCIGNTAYFGVPLALAFLPAEALPITIGYDLGATLTTWSVGPLLLAGTSSGSVVVLKGLFASLLNSPASRGLMGALLVQWTPWQAALAELLWWPSRLVMLLALGVVGLRLGALSRHRGLLRPLGSELLPALVGKLLVFPAALLLLGLVLRFDPLLIRALVLQGAAPTAISVLLIAEAVDRDQAHAAGLVFWSTVAALVIAPIWGLLLPVLTPAL